MLPPHPPLQVDWVILRRLGGREQATVWLGSPKRRPRVDLRDAALLNLACAVMILAFGRRF